VNKASVLAEAIESAINDSGTIFHASIWSKKGIRIYVHYWNGNKKKECGYIGIGESGEIDRRLTLQAGTIEALYSESVAEVNALNLQSDKVDDPKQIVEECWECGAEYFDYGNVEAGNMSCRRCG
jgi:hypothetical protein